MDDIEFIKDIPVLHFCVKQLTTENRLLREEKEKIIMILKETLSNVPTFLKNDLLKKYDYLNDII